jgi:hypothetical protein
MAGSQWRGVRVQWASVVELCRLYRSWLARVFSEIVERLCPRWVANQRWLFTFLMLMPEVAAL